MSNLTREQINDLMDQARAFCRANLVQICQELHDWGTSEDGTLVNGKLREMAAMLMPLDTHKHLTIAQRMAESMAVECVTRVRIGAWLETSGEAAAEENPLLQTLNRKAVKALARAWFSYILGQTK